MDTLVNIETGEIKWDEIKKLRDSEIENKTFKFQCKKCRRVFYSKTYYGNYPLCRTHLYGHLPVKNPNL